MVQAFLPRAADPPFRDGIRAGRPVGSARHLQILRFEHRVKGPAELRVAIMDHEAERPALVLKGPTQVARVLRHPGRRRMRRAPRQVHPPRA